ncbi:hypothetical protein L1987_58024 [Smallanthus sonchifolius]|uniref:Uncharacterized protein n=1 Tax=Smallanthus sonchifolius TaxID=185202 RepID=A0ACB9DF86_9ASTR|nr:hypothetical protein L1987_58024 [Smallanthus sonchifolius]
MASSSSTILFACFLVVLWRGGLYANGCYPSIISFGDPLADTGNRKLLASTTNYVRFTCGPPYGQNFIGQFTGRCSNGRLIIDFLDCRNFIGRSLIIMGEIGGNDYNFPLSRGKTIDEVQSNVPLVIDTIVSTVNEEYDPTTGCLSNLNKFVEYHNRMLQTNLDKIRELNPNVIIIYADYYNVALQIYHSPDEYGFTNGALKACCGCGGPFNYNESTRCGHESTIVCDEPDTYVSWDGSHLTEAAYKLIFNSLFQGPYTTPGFYSLCPMTTTSQAGTGLSNTI